VLVTEWKQYLALDWAGLRSHMRVPVLIDGRNVLDRSAMEDAGYRYLRIP
jgi:UDPglucose 6-dehydrogenase